ncbi:peptidyl-prolyl cis-trans isomerase D [Klebsiella pneumoniae]|uniref:Peptidyl-prolyl cis-trans isomerase D n=1 Tax=Klebsiella pneumoniae TaxID=573 RepID=A0A2X3FK03_KLEPN|nr:peptidyl-prolyl cis-trans isomerase D [Klebsiella pneumoniae]
MGMTTDQYAQALRNQLTTQQLINAIAGTDFMLPASPISWRRWYLNSGWSAKRPST